MTAHLTAIADGLADVRDMPGRVLAMLPPEPPISELKRLWLAAADADEAVQDHLRSTLPMRGREDRTLGLLEDRACDAERALRDYLLDGHGLTSGDLRRSVL